MMDDRALRQADAILSGLPRFADQGAGAYKPGLERMRALLSALGNPEAALQTIHVAGTNGKGSTASFIASIAQAHGLRTGLHTSPHLFRVTERMRVDGEPATDEWLAQAVLSARALVDEVNPSFFELTVALSLLYFQQKAVEVAVIEVGMGGRLDATNVLIPRLSVITDIGLDHTEFLGDTVEAVAREKAGIVKEGVPVVTGARGPAVAVIREAAERQRSDFHPVDGEMSVLASDIEIRRSTITVRSPMHTYSNLVVGLAGKHQIRNALTAIRAAELVLAGLDEDTTAVSDGLRDVRTAAGLRGRLEVLHEHPLVVADVAHNADGLATVLEHLRACGALRGRLTVLLGLMRDKDVAAMGRLLAEVRAVVRPVPVNSERALHPGELDQALQVVEVNVAEPCTVPEGIRSFLSDASHADTLLVAGSHLVVAQLEGSAP